MIKKGKPLILGVITARGGSKSIPGKNIKILGGKPLIAYTIEAAKKSERITRLIISTDDREIASVCERCGADVPFIQPSHLATDKSGHLEVMKHAIEFMEEKDGVVFDYVVILQPTSPFRLPEDIDKTIDKLINEKTDSSVSLVQIDSGEHPIKAKKLENGLVVPYCMKEPEGLRRQDFPIAYKRSGAAYAMRRDLIMKDGRLYGDRITGHIVPTERSIDIDTPLDWIKAEYMLADLKTKGFPL
ncbi:MAG: acylneuraminate cytidylyltransferase family protein [Candidatus Zambryskibacteria bacterium]|nr:acylneuraminate cytidylyltransferase family protein [Candidatus Zambryskibacteria bacterium]